MTSKILLPWLVSAGGEGERKSVRAFQGNGTTGSWEIQFAGGYIDKAHVKAYRYDPVSATAHPQTLTFLGANQIKTADPIPSDQYIVIYRDTPKDKPLVDYNEGAVLSEKNLDTTAQQPVFATAEMVDRYGAASEVSQEALAQSTLALDTANTAEATANIAMSDAAQAVATANTAGATANSAMDAASTAVNIANGIDAKAQTALDNSIAAVGTANTAEATANTALAVANGVDAKATQAQTDAAQAVGTANNAVATANTAAAIANGIDAKATQAQADAAAALSATGNAGTNIPGLPQAPNIHDAQQFEVDDSGTSYRATFQQIREKLKTQFDGDYAAHTHSHAPSHIVGLQTALNSKAAAAHTHTAEDISDSTPVGRAVMTAADAAAARSALAVPTLGDASDQAKPGDWKPNLATEDTVGQLPWSRLSDIPSSVGASGLPAALGVGSYVMAWFYFGHVGVGGAITGAELRGVSFLQGNAGGTTVTILSVVGAALPGTWRNMGTGTYSAGMVGLFLRIA